MVSSGIAWSNTPPLSSSSSHPAFRLSCLLPATNRRRNPPWAPGGALGGAWRARQARLPRQLLRNGVFQPQRPRRRRLVSRALFSPPPSTSRCSGRFRSPLIPNDPRTFWAGAKKEAARPHARHHQPDPLDALAAAGDDDDDAGAAIEDEDDCIESGALFLEEFEQWKRSYYMEKMHVDIVDRDFLLQQAQVSSYLLSASPFSSIRMPLTPPHPQPPRPM